MHYGTTRQARQHTTKVLASRFAVTVKEHLYV